MKLKTQDKCNHCHHVTVLAVKVGFAQWLAGICLVAVVTLGINKIGELIALRVKDAPPATNTSERLGSDRVEHVNLK